MRVLLPILLMLCALPASAAEPPLRVDAGIQQQHDGAATVVMVVRGSGPTAFQVAIPPGWDVTRTHASTGLLTDDASPIGTPPSVVRWSGVVSDTAPALVWVELLALPGATSGPVVVSGEGQQVMKWVRAPGGVAPAPRQVRRLWIPIARHEKAPPVVWRRWLPWVGRG